MNVLKSALFILAALLITACGDDDIDSSIVIAPDTYNFASVVDPSAPSSVDYEEATTRNVLIQELSTLIASTTLHDLSISEEVKELLDRVYSRGTISPTGADDTRSLINSDLYCNPGSDFEDCDAIDPTEVSVDFEEGLAADSSQIYFTGLSADINLKAKVAVENGDSEAFSLEEVEGVACDVFIGSIDSCTTPKTLIDEWFDIIAELAAESESGSPDSGVVDSSHYTKDDVDYKSLLETFLLGAINFSQTAQVHLSVDSIDGLMAQNTSAHTDGASYTSLEHAWDMAFGYFGAAQEYGYYNDSQNSSLLGIDGNGDALIDLFTEYNFDFAKYAAKRDFDSPQGTTDFTQNVMNAFLTGRQIIQDNYGVDPLEGAKYHNELVAQAKIILNNWEKIIAASIFHYRNEMYRGTSEEYPKNFAMMKGLAFGFQFNPIPIISSENILEIHNKMRVQPEPLDSDDLVEYGVDLDSVETILKTTYEFSNEDADKFTGW